MDTSMEDRDNFRMVLMAEDDADDRFFMGKAIEAASCGAELRFVKDGAELMDYLQRRGRFNDHELSPRPSLILLDLNMPRKDGRQALAEIKADPVLKEIPLVIWTTSDLQEDRVKCREAGANGYVRKPDSYTELENAVKKIVAEWLG